MNLLWPEETARPQCCRSLAGTTWREIRHLEPHWLWCGYPFNYIKEVLLFLTKQISGTSKGDNTALGQEESSRLLRHWQSMKSEKLSKPEVHTEMSTVVDGKAWRQPGKPELRTDTMRSMRIWHRVTTIKPSTCLTLTRESHHKKCPPSKTQRVICSWMTRLSLIGERNTTATFTTFIWWQTHASFKTTRRRTQTRRTHKSYGKRLNELFGAWREEINRGGQFPRRVDKRQQGRDNEGSYHTIPENVGNQAVATSMDAVTGDTPKKGNAVQKYQMISLISHLNKVILKAIQKWLIWVAEELLVEE